MVERLPAVEANLDRVAHQMTLANRLGTGMSNNTQSDVVARIEREARKGAQFSPSQTLVALATEFALDCPIFAVPRTR